MTSGASGSGSRPAGTQSFENLAYDPDMDVQEVRQIRSEYRGVLSSQAGTSVHEHDSFYASYLFQTCEALVANASVDRNTRELGWSQSIESHRGSGTGQLDVRQWCVHRNNLTCSPANLTSPFTNPGTYSEARPGSHTGFQGHDEPIRNGRAQGTQSEAQCWGLRCRGLSCETNDVHGWPRRGWGCGG